MWDTTFSYVFFCPRQRSYPLTIFSEQSKTLLCPLTPYLSATEMLHRQFSLSTVIPSDRFNACRSILICSSHVLLGLPRPRLPSTWIPSTLLTGSVTPLLRTWPNHLHLFSLSLSLIVVIPNFSLYTLFGILSSLVQLHIHLSILISATSNLRTSASHRPTFGAVDIVGRIVVL